MDSSLDDVYAYATADKGTDYGGIYKYSSFFPGLPKALTNVCRL